MNMLHYIRFASGENKMMTLNGITHKVVRGFRMIEYRQGYDCFQNGKCRK